MLLREYIERYRITTSTLGRDLGVSRQCVSGIVSGKKKPSLALAKRIEQHTRGIVSRIDLLYPEDVDRLYSEDSKEEESVVQKG